MLDEPAVLVDRRHDAKLVNELGDRDVVLEVAEPADAAAAAAAAAAASTAGCVGSCLLGRGGAEPVILSGLADLKPDRRQWARKLLLLAAAFLGSLAGLLAIAASLPNVNTLQSALASDGAAASELAATTAVTPAEPLLLRVPRNLVELRAVRSTLDLYGDQYETQVVVGFSCLYLFLQTFVVPGCLFLNLLAGSLFDFYEALALITASFAAIAYLSSLAVSQEVLVVLGSSLCYYLSSLVLRDIVYHYFPAKCEALSREVHKHRHSLVNYMLVLRITQVLPNWFVNVGSPLISVPFRSPPLLLLQESLLCPAALPLIRLHVILCYDLALNCPHFLAFPSSTWRVKVLVSLLCRPFFLANLLGSIPGSWVQIKAGRILSRLNSVRDLYDAQTILTVVLIAGLSFLPVVIRRQMSTSKLRHFAQALSKLCLKHFCDFRYAFVHREMQYDQKCHPISIGPISRKGGDLC
eukprot:SM000003S10989  [mRNA]  locus=s3:119140:121243:- [translate_table: standard]